MTPVFDSFTNRGEFFAAHYFAEQLPVDLAKGLLGTWTTRENDEHHAEPTPRQSLRRLRSRYLDPEHRAFFAESLARAADGDGATDGSGTYANPAWTKQLQLWHRALLDALGYGAGPQQVTVHRAGRTHVVDVAWAGAGMVALDCGWAAVTDDVLTADGAVRLLHPLVVGASESYDTGQALASWLFQCELGERGAEPPRLVLLLCGGVLLLADRQTWAEGRFLSVDLDMALERNNRAQTGELAVIAALFCHETLIGRDGTAPLLDTLLAASTNNATGVTDQLREGLQRSVEIIANEVLARLDEAGIDPREIEKPRIPIARELTREGLRYLYRILFLLYAEARPELGILPSDDRSYEAGYSVGRLRGLVERDQQLVEEEARTGFHLFASLDLLFDKVNHGHAAAPGDGRGLRFEPLRSDLFEPGAIRLIGTGVPHPADDDRTLDLRLRNAALHEVLRLLTMKQGSARGLRGGFISYRNLGINQLGAVYEGLMSYSGIIADGELCEVAKDGRKPDKGSWLVPAHRQTDYPEHTLVTYDDHDAQRGLRGPKRYPRGRFVYRLAGRDRETSASYYTPESLTKVTVELALKHRLDQECDAAGTVIPTRAAELLRWTICEPALGSGAFLNEAINQVAEEYLRRRQAELGMSIGAADLLAEKQRVKAYIALHNAYGVDLNVHGVELAEVSLWLNTMHPGMQAPWFGLHLRRGNSLIGARRAVYAGSDVTDRAKTWQKVKGLAPTPLPYPADLPVDAVHQFLLPSPGWAAAANAKEAKALVPERAAAFSGWRSRLLTKPTDAQPGRLAAAARRVEYLWSLVAKRMEISERAIARSIPVWGADGEEFGFLRRPAHAVPKEQVFADLFDAVDTPYWRLKHVMDAWCALWFWPLDRVALLDGTDPGYAVSDAPDDLAAVLPTVDLAPARAEQVVLFPVEGEQMTLDEVTTVLAPLKAQKKGPQKQVIVRRRRVIPLAGLDDWLDFLESMLGTGDVPEGSLIEQFETLDQLTEHEDQLPFWMGMDTADPEQRYPWLHVVHEIAHEQGFLHWELEFAAVFRRDDGGFDLQVGNPPWVRPEWKEDPALAESEPWFALTEKPNAADKARRRAAELARPGVLDRVAAAATVITSTAAFIRSPQVYPLIAGSRPDLYRAFMCQTWVHARVGGSIGLLHPDTHFSGEKEALLREASYHRLRVHADFVNAGNRFFPPPVGRSSHFGVHIYGAEREIDFLHMSWLFSVNSLRLSEGQLVQESDEPPGIRYQGRWDERPHPQRIIRVTPETLTRWQRLSPEEDQPIGRTRLLTPVSTAEDPAIDALGLYPVRLVNLDPQVTSGLNETNAKKEMNGPSKDLRLIEYNKDRADYENYATGSWADVVLKGPQLGVANPLFKQPSHGDGEVLGLDLSTLSPDAVPESEYYRVADEAIFLDEQDSWIDHVDLARRQQSDTEVASAREVVADALGTSAAEASADAVDAVLARRSSRPATTFYRLAWRRQIAPDTERALFAAIVPPGPSHVDLVQTLCMPNPRSTVLVGGFWASLPLDYLLRTSGRGDMRVAVARTMPSPSANHPLASALLLRTLRLNCLTTAYADLWSELYDPTWPGYEGWAIDWPGLQPLHNVTPEWRYPTPLRSERARRSALVEIDALVAVWLGIPAATLTAMYRARFPIMQDFDDVTWFDAAERKIAGDRYTYGHGQTKEHWAQFQAHLAAPGEIHPPESYTPPFHKADREAEMAAAHAVFQARVDAAVDRGEWARP